MPRTLKHPVVTSNSFGKSPIAAVVLNSEGEGRDRNDQPRRSLIIRQWVVRHKEATEVSTEKAIRTGSTSFDLAEFAHSNYCRD